jgi:hypothetical protein
MLRAPSTALFILSCLVTQACRPCYELRSVRGEATSGFSVTDASRSVTTAVALYATLDNARDDPAYNVIANDVRSGGDNLMVTLYGFETPPGDRIAVTVSIPLSAGTGERFAISRAFTAPEQGMFGFRQSLAAGQVELGFSRSQYINPGNYTFGYVANTASGEIRVLRRQPGVMELSVDALVSNGTGPAYRIVGPILLTTRTQGDVCPSIT